MATNKKINCSFCGRTKSVIENADGMILSGIEGHICNSCIQQGYEVIKEELGAPALTNANHQFELVKPKDLKAYLDEYVIGGVKTTIPFHQKLMQNEDFCKGNFTTKFMETFEF